MSEKEKQLSITKRVQTLAAPVEKTFGTMFGKDAERVFKQEQLFAISAVRENPKLLEDVESLQLAIADVALTGVSLNPTTALAYLVPRKGKACLAISYMGMIEILRNSGSVKNITGSVVYDCDEFDFSQGTGAYLKHKPVLNRNKDAKPVAAYAVATLPDGTEQFHIMDWNAIMKRRDKSDGKNSTYSPWTNWEEEMAIKTVIRAFFKFLPKTQQAQNAVRVIEGEMVDIETGEVIEDNQDI